MGQVVHYVLSRVKSDTLNHKGQLCQVLSIRINFHKKKYANMQLNILPLLLSIYLQPGILAIKQSVKISVMIK